MRTALRILAITLAAYYVITLLVITPALNILPGWYVEKNWGRTLDTRWVILNPFKLSLDLASAKLSEPDGEHFLEIGDSSVNLSLSSLWQSGVVLDELTLHDLDVKLVRSGEERFNFSDLMPAADDSAPEEESGPPPGVTIHLVDISAKRIAVSDLTRKTPYSSEWTGLKLNVHELSTVLEEGKPYLLEFSGPDGGTLRWEGTLSIPGEYSEGTLQIADVHMHTLWQAAEPWLKFEVESGRLGLAAGYRISWQEPLSYQLDEGRFELNELAIVPRDASALPETNITLRELVIDGIDVSSETLSAQVDGVAIDGLAASGFSEGTRISLAEMIMGPADPNEPVAAEEPPAADEDSDAPQWSAQLDDFQVSDSTINWRSEYTEPALLAVTPIAIEASNLQWPLAGEAPFGLTLSINDTAAFELQGKAILDTGSAELSYALSELPLSWFNPNLPQALNAAITDGRLGLDGSLTLGDFQPLNVKLDAAITDFAAQQEGEETTFTRWDAVRASGLEVDLDASAVALQQLEISGYAGRLHIHEDGSINASKIWQAEMAAAEDNMADNGETSAGTAAETGDADADSNGDATPEESTPWSIDLEQVLIGDSQVDFMDESLPITFRAVIGELNGRINGISSTPGTAADVDIKGSVNETAPVTLTGTASPLADPMALDLELDFKAVDMALLSPYSATYAGYKIKSGLLDLELDYKLDNDQLRGENNLRLDQFTLGGKVDSEKAINAPLELAIAIMTDSNGVIDMSVPVSGSVDDPSFELGSVISKAFVGALTGIVTAPFKALASLVGTEADLHLLSFTPGSAEPGAGTQQKLADLATALSQRPKIRLALDGRVDAEEDRARLQLNALRESLLEDGLSPEALDSKNESWSAAIDRRFAQLPGAAEAAETTTTREKQRELAATFSVTDAQLVELAQARALSVKTWLVDEAGVSPERAVIGATNLSDGEHRFSGVELDIR